MTDSWHLADTQVSSRLMIGSALYPSPEVMQSAIEASGAEVVTVSLRRQTAGQNTDSSYWSWLKQLPVHWLPNTAGCYGVREAVTTAQMAREVFGTHWLKLEVIGDEQTLQPDPFGLVEAADILIRDGFEVFPYMTDDLVLAQRLVDVGCRILMPWASPIGSGQGIRHPQNIMLLRERFPQVQLIVDAGLGRPSDATEAMEFGCDGVLLNSAIALSPDPTRMAGAFEQAVSAGRLGYRAGIMPQRQWASASTPTIGTPFWHQVP
ncbi:MAG: thiazole synthase [Hydrogenovibrio sp.]|uniref:thiazole synthase n=1 Tax=Hydrogenovibrio sp. TaxID=2065821 RepID=UPI002870352B|nr:thiazole synthase [Hydrogenovibrio sp.]MDR9498311.1 thiazole synthase [Hydrogenovibrio sp.]